MTPSRDGGAGLGPLLGACDDSGEAGASNQTKCAPEQLFAVNHVFTGPCWPRRWKCWALHSGLVSPPSWIGIGTIGFVCGPRAAMGRFATGQGELSRAQEENHPRELPIAYLGYCIGRGAGFCCHVLASPKKGLPLAGSAFIDGSLLANCAF